MKKICFIASSGGHLEQINQLKGIMDIYNYFYVTEKTKATIQIKEKKYFIIDNPRKNIFVFIIRMIILIFQSLKIFLNEKPDIIISTGANITIPMCFIAKVFRKKVVFIESFAKIDKPSKTGKILYKIADLFIIQWKALEKYYPNAVYGGWIY